MSKDQEQKEFGYSKDKQLGRTDKVNLEKTYKRKCKVKECDNRFETPRSKFWVWWCSDKHQDKYFKEQLIKNKKKAAEKENKEWKKRKEILKNEVGKKKPKIDQLQSLINKIIHYLDEGKPCLARPFDRNLNLEAGHVHPRSRHPSLKYHLDNIHLQGNYSNSSQKDDKLMLEGLEIRYGKEFREYVEFELPKRYPILKLTKPEKTEKCTIARRVIDELKQGKIYTRDDINKRLGIYK